MSTRNTPVLVLRNSPIQVSIVFDGNILNSLNCKKNIMIDLTILTGIYILLAVLMIY